MCLALCVKPLFFRTIKSCVGSRCNKVHSCELLSIRINAIEILFDFFQFSFTIRKVDRFIGPVAQIMRRFLVFDQIFQIWTIFILGAFGIFLKKKSFLPSSENHFFQTLETKFCFGTFQDLKNWLMTFDLAKTMFSRIVWRVSLCQVNVGHPWGLRFFTK